MSEETESYYYLHTNGDLIYKPSAVVESDKFYFNSPFVKKVWRINPRNRSDAWWVLIEGMALGANPLRVAALATKWGCDGKDLMTFLMLNPSPTELQVRGLAALITEILKLDPVRFWADVALLAQKMEQEKGKA